MLQDILLERLMRALVSLDQHVCRRDDLPRNPSRVTDLGYPQVMVHLQIQPGTRVTTEIARQAHGRVGRDRAALQHDVVDPRSGHAQGLRQRVRAQSQGLQEIFLQDFPRVDGSHAITGHGDLSARSVVLVVDSDAVLPGGDARNASVAAACNGASLRVATPAIRLNRRDLPVSKRACVSR